MTIFVRGKQKRVQRPPTIDGLSVEETDGTTIKPREARGCFASWPV